MIRIYHSTRLLLLWPFICSYLAKAQSLHQPPLFIQIISLCPFSSVTWSNSISDKENRNPHSHLKVVGLDESASLLSLPLDVLPTVSLDSREPIASVIIFHLLRESTQPFRQAKEQSQSIPQTRYQHLFFQICLWKSEQGQLINTSPRQPFRLQMKNYMEVAEVSLWLSSRVWRKENRVYRLCYNDPSHPDSQFLCFDHPPDSWCIYLTETLILIMLGR